MKESLARIVERERCARIADAIAAHYRAPNGGRLRGSAGAKQIVAEDIARLIRQDDIQPGATP